MSPPSDVHLSASTRMPSAERRPWTPPRAWICSTEKATRIAHPTASISGSPPTRAILEARVSIPGGGRKPPPPGENANLVLLGHAPEPVVLPLAPPLVALGAGDAVAGAVG